MGKDWDKSIDGMTERTERAFRQDAELAMGADPVRAIVELVTNSDDAYVKAGERRKGSIRIEVERRRKASSLIGVRDRAGGMTLDEMQERLGKEASRTSGFEGDLDVRGLLGRGAKDCAAFGKVTWESVTPDEVARWELSANGRYRGFRRKRGRTNSDELRTGTEATLEVDPRFTLKTHSNLAQALTRHYELRPCLMDREGREVHLVDLNQERDAHLVYDLPKGELVANETMPIDGFEGDSARVKLYMSEENLDDGWDREYWKHGLLIKAGRAAYDVFAGRFEQEQWAPYFGHFYGEVDVPAISRLIREYDDLTESNMAPTRTNPVRLVTRDRRGLAKNHPFTVALMSALESFVSPYVEKLRKDREAAAEAKGLTQRTQERLRGLGKVLGQFFQEEEESIGDDEQGEPSPGLQVIPSAQVVEPDSVARFTVRLRPEPTRWPDLTPSARMALVSGAAAVVPEEMELRDRGEYFSRSFTVTDLAEGELCEIEVSAGDYVATCVLECRRAPAPDPIDSLQFEHSTYRVKDGGTRVLKVLAPWELVADETTTLQVSISGDSSITLESSEGVFAYDYDRQCGRAAVAVHGRTVGSRAKVTAALGEQVAVAELEVTVSGSGLIRFEFVDKPLPQRALWDADVLKISAIDKSIARYLGSSPDFPGQEQVHFRTILAELVAFHSVRRVVDRRRKNAPSESVNLYREHMQLERKCLPRVHAALVGADEA
jgi:hypothetical protein